MNDAASTSVERFIADHPDIRQVEVLATDLCGHFFGKRYPIDKLPEFARDGLAFPAATLVLSTLGLPLDGLYYGIDDGDPDARFRLLPESLCRVDWGNQPRAQVLATAAGGDTPAFFEPRQVLLRVLDEYRARGWQPTVAFELEFYLFAGRDDDGGLRLARSPKTGETDTANVLASSRLGDFEAVIDAIVDACELQGIDTGAISAELGPGQFEINLHHHADVLRAADETCLFKRSVTEIAKSHGLLGSFIAKPLLDEAGNGLHMHISVVDDDGANIFDGGGEPHPLLLQAIGGLLAVMPGAMSLWAPNVNSYRRYRGGTSCAPVSLSWAQENRTVPFRIPLAHGGAWRVENRVPGADANPYLAMAASLAGMLHGIDNRLDPGAPAAEAIADADPALPLSLADALAVTREDPALNRFLGTDFIDLYCRHRAAEAAAFHDFIGAREYDWYL